MNNLDKIKSAVTKKDERRNSRKILVLAGDIEQYLDYIRGSA
jgi:hypothetical protein